MKVNAIMNKIWLGIGIKKGTEKILKEKEILAGFSCPRAPKTG